MHQVYISVLESTFYNPCICKNICKLRAPKWCFFDRFLFSYFFLKPGRRWLKQRSGHGGRQKARGGCIIKYFPSLLRSVVPWTIPKTNKASPHVDLDLQVVAAARHSFPGTYRTPVPTGLAQPEKKVANNLMFLIERRNRIGWKE